MNKSTFVKKLRSKLQILDNNEVEEIISEYSAHIDQKIADGKSEEEAIKDFGDINELANDILSAYHIEGKSKTLEDYVSIVLEFFNDATSKILKYESKELGSFIVEFVLTCLILAVVKLPIKWVLNALGVALSFITIGVFSPLYTLLSVLFEIIYFIGSIYVLYIVFSRRFGDNAQNEIKAEPQAVILTDEKEKPIKAKKDKSYFKSPEYKKNIKEENEMKEEKEEVIVEEVIVEETIKEKEKPIVSSNKNDKPVLSTSNGVTDFFMLLVKVVVGIFVWFPAFVVLLMALVALGIVVSLVVVGFKFVWLLLIIGGSILICLAIVVPLSKLIWGKL